MPPDRRSPEDPREWLRRARSNLTRGTALEPGTGPGHQEPYFANVQKRLTKMF